MRLPLQLPHVAFRCGSNRPEWIGIGVAILLLNGFCPEVPVVTAMALVAFGATATTLKRFGNAPQGALVVAFNLLVYCGLYALFVGVTLHQIGLRPDHRLSVPALFDLVTSVWPMAIVIQQSLHAIVRCQSAE